MSIMNKVKVAGEKALVESKNARVMKAAKTLHESVLGKKCPNLVKMIESGDKESQYKATMMTQLLENTMAKHVAEYKNPSLFTEDVTSAQAGLMPGVASLTPRVVDVVNIFYPQMIAHHICDIQALDRQTGEIFIIKAKYAETAAGVQAGDTIFEKPTNGTYASELLLIEAAAATAGTTWEGTFTLPTPTPDTEGENKIRAGSVRIYKNGKLIATDYGTGVLVGKDVDSTASTVDYATGAVALTVKTALVTTDMMSAQAAVDSEIEPGYIRKDEFVVDAQPITAQEHPLMSTYSVASSLVMNAHLALDTDELISNMLAGHIRWERDLLLVDYVNAAAKNADALEFDCAANGTNLTLKQRYNSFDVFVSSARGVIQEQAGRGTVDFIIVSATQGLVIVEQMDGFVAAPESKKPIGPYLAGTLRDGTIAVIAVPYSNTLAADEVIFGFKGFQMGDSAVILAEWVPLYFTPTFQAPNLKNHKGALSFYDLFVNKPEYLTKGLISHFNG